jgi:hypothetical protein
MVLCSLANGARAIGVNAPPGPGYLGNKKERVPGGPLSKPFGSSDRYEVSMTDAVNIAVCQPVASGCASGCKRPFCVAPADKTRGQRAALARLSFCGIQKNKMLVVRAPPWRDNEWR